MDRFTDLAVIDNGNGLYDLDLDSDLADAATDGGLYGALLISLFTDRRAASDEVADPMKRRGWIGDLVSDVPGDRIGSGLWLYAQSRLTPDIQAAIEGEARSSLQWMIDERLVAAVAVATVADHAARTLSLNVTLTLVDGRVSQHAFVLANATRTGLLSNTGSGRTVIDFTSRRLRASQADFMDADKTATIVAMEI